MKPQTTTIHTNTPRRAHPAAVRAALRLRDLIGASFATLALLLLTLPIAVSTSGDRLGIGRLGCDANE